MDKGESHIPQVDREFRAPDNADAEDEELHDVLPKKPGLGSKLKHAAKIGAVVAASFMPLKGEAQEGEPDRQEQVVDQKGQSQTESEDKESSGKLEKLPSDVEMDAAWMWKNVGHAFQHDGYFYVVGYGRADRSITKIARGFAENDAYNTLRAALKNEDDAKSKGKGWKRRWGLQKSEKFDVKPNGKFSEVVVLIQVEDLEPPPLIER